LFLVPWAGLRGGAVTVAICRLTLRLPENTSLKGKRMVVKSVQQRLHNRFNVSVAEVSHNDAWQLAGLEIAAVSNSRAHASEIVANAVTYVETLRLDVEVIDEDTEIID
jgi:uncharacterized protein YlxP (DUF503 family)